MRYSYHLREVGLYYDPQFSYKLLNMKTYLRVNEFLRGEYDTMKLLMLILPQALN